MPPAGEALTCPPSISSAVAGFYISLSNHLLRPSGPERPSERPVTYEGISVFITSVKAAVSTTPSPPPPLPPSLGGEPQHQHHGNLAIISLTLKNIQPGAQKRRPDSLRGLESRDLKPDTWTHLASAALSHELWIAQF